MQKVDEMKSSTCALVRLTLGKTYKIPQGLENLHDQSVR